MKRIIVSVVGLIAFLMLAADSCSGGSPTAQDQASNKATNLQSQVYSPKNNLEFNNYNDRQKIADDPTTILWCTAYFANPNVKPITVPIVGKLTSSNKRPFPTSQVQYQDNYNPELPGPDGMYGASSEYRYGFTPGHVYVDFTDVATLCTTQPTVYQATQTDIVLKLDSGLNAASQAARRALAAGAQKGGTINAAAAAQAEAILEQVVGSGGK